jgi:predicted  nucleic acid-binding Zn-ribbon protein
MNPDLERLIALQRLDTAARDAERRLAEEPERQHAFDARLEEARLRLASAKQHLADSQTARRGIEKDVAVHQGRLSKFREQAMAVKTNQEYHAVQHEIAFAESEVKALEDRILERMLEADDLTSAVKRAETELTAEQKAVDAERRTLSADLAALRETLERAGAERRAIALTIDPHVLAIFELVSRRRNGVAMAEAKQGMCTLCHVRLRPQVFNTVLRNEQILQCDSCQRILYYTPAPLAPADSVPQPAP